MFFPNLAFKLFKFTGINNHAIELVDSPFSFYGPIYSLGLVELKTLKTYIETNLANKFIKIFKLPVDILIYFDRKLNKFFWLCVNYKDFNNLIFKNQYLLLLVKKLLNKLDWARRFFQLNFTNAYYEMRICKGKKQKIAF